MDRRVPQRGRGKTAGTVTPRSMASASPAWAGINPSMGPDYPGWQPVPPRGRG